MRTYSFRLVVSVFALALVALALVPSSPSSHAARSASDTNEILTDAPDAQTSASQKAEIHGFDTASLDKTCSPCNDFNQFANGGWQAKNQIPAAYPSWGRFNELQDKNQAVLHTILDEARSNTKAAKGSNEQKIAGYYGSCMDEDKIEAEGLKPLQPELDLINNVSDTAGLQAEITHLHSLRLPGVFGFRAGQDYKKSTEVIANISQGGIGLPDRDYYLNDSPKSKETREKYTQHIVKTFALAGDDAATATAAAQTVMNLETELAKVSMDRVERRNPDKTYHKMTVAQLNELTPNFNWTTYFKTLGIPASTDINVQQPDFLKAVNGMLTSVPLNDWKTYLRWHLLRSTSPLLSKAFVEEDFDFNGRFLTGAKEMLPRWKRCVSGTDAALGEAVGQVYVKRAFTPETKQHAMEMVKNLIEALRSDLSTLSWMSPATRQRAIAKLNAFDRKIGYPDKWRDYATLDIASDSYFQNAMHARAFDLKRDIGEIGKPIDRTEWGMTPPTVNAYYNPSMNEIVFPAGILQPPFYDPKADDAINYGGIGAVIGHEMTHGFDDQGAKFDAEGNLVDWWTPEDKKNFNERTDCVVKQFNGFVVEPGLNQNGKLVVGESVADLGGLTVSYAAFQNSLKGKPKPKSIDGFSPEQRFFLAWAQVWASNDRAEFARQMTLTNPHPLARFRVNGPLSNMPQFAMAFGCKQGEPMVRPPADRCQIW
jgi:putative endopeptidase